MSAWLLQTTVGTLPYQVFVVMTSEYIDMTTYHEPFKTFWDIDATVEYIVSRVFRVVTLQFPDDLLKDATAVAGALTSQCHSRGQEIKASQCCACLSAIDRDRGRIRENLLRAGLCHGRHHI